MATNDWENRGLNQREWSKFDGVMETIGSLNAGTGSSGSGTFNYYFDMEGFKYFTVQIENTTAGSANTYTFEGSAMNAGTGSATFQDMTSALFGVANVTDDTMWVNDTPVPLKWGKVKVVHSGTGGAWNVYVKKLW